MGNFVTAVAHLIMAIGEFGYKNPSFIELNKLELNFINTVNARFYVYPPKKKSDILYLVTDNPRTIVYNYFYTS